MNAIIGRKQTEKFRFVAVAKALKLYGKTGIRANRSYTPKAMLAVAKELTGMSYRYGQYLEAADHMEKMLDPDAKWYGVEATFVSRDKMRQFGAEAQGVEGVHTPEWMLAQMKAAIKAEHGCSLNIRIWRRVAA